MQIHCANFWLYEAISSELGKVLLFPKFRISHLFLFPHYIYTYLLTGMFLITEWQEDAISELQEDAISFTFIDALFKRS